MATAEPWRLCVETRRLSEQTAGLSEQRTSASFLQDREQLISLHLHQSARSRMHCSMAAQWNGCKCHVIGHRMTERQIKIRGRFQTAACPEPDQYLSGNGGCQIKFQMLKMVRSSLTKWPSWAMGGGEIEHFGSGSHLGHMRSTGSVLKKSILLRDRVWHVALIRLCIFSVFI